MSERIFTRKIDNMRTAIGITPEYMIEVKDRVRAKIDDFKESGEQLTITDHLQILYKEAKKSNDDLVAVIALLLYEREIRR